MIAAASVERFLAKMLCVVVYIDQRRQAVLAGRMTYLVVVFRVDNSSKDVAGHFLFEHALDGTKIAIRIVDLSSQRRAGHSPSCHPIGC